ncbi:MAG: nucleotidyltransferase domain-containing protein [Herpetosiphon sp.]|nr:nucleotidyltransferase domain-containing protein [Herpetosiphon sp.]
MNPPDLIRPETLHLIQTRIKTLYAVYVFGSRASERTTTDSDLDLAILGKPALSLHERIDLSDEIAIIEQCEVDIIDVFQASTVMQHEIIKMGKRVYVDGTFADEYEIFISRNYEDLQLDRRAILEDIIRRRSVYGRRDAEQESEN